MKERPILFSAPMVRAILVGTKTQTRRVVKLGPSGRAHFGGRNWHLGDPDVIKACPYGQLGDRLWVREAWMPVEHDSQPVRYRASNPSYAGKWRPSIHMPRWASRILLEIGSVRVERLLDISEADAEAEGVDFIRRVPDVDETMTAVELYEALWESINGPGSWDANPFVWCVEFKRVQP